MDDKFKKLTFKDFITVDHAMTGDEYLAYQAQKRRRGHFDTQGESVEHVGEDMDVGQRRKAGQRMKRMANRIKIAKKKSMKRTPTGDVVDKRARKQARAELGKKLSGGKSTSDLSVAQRRQVGKKVNKQQGRLDSLTKRKRPEVRKMHRDRMSSANKAD